MPRGRVRSLIDPTEYIPAPKTPPAVPLPVTPIPAPATPPILVELVAAHAVFVTRKRKEREEYAAWLVAEADRVDRRARYVAWLVATANQIDCDLSPRDLD